MSKALKDKTKKPLNGRQYQSFQNTNGITLKIKESDLVRVDLHMRRSTEVSEAILQGISDAHLKSVNIVEVVHGYNGGMVLKQATTAELAGLKKAKIVKDFYPSPQNPGSTIVHL